MMRPSSSGNAMPHATSKGPSPPVDDCHDSEEPVDAIAWMIGTPSEPSTFSPQPSAAMPAAISSPGAKLPAAKTVVTIASTSNDFSNDATADSSPSPPSRSE